MINVPSINQSATLTPGTVLPKAQTKPANGSLQNTTNQTTPPKYTATIYPDKTMPVYTQTATEPKLIHTSWLYVNDVHGKMTNMERIYNISKEFDSTPVEQMSKSFYSNTMPVSKFKVASGDIILGANYTNNQVANQFLNWSGFIASALGNHELDVVEPGDLAKLLNNAKYKMLAINVDVNKDSPIHGRIEKSMIVEKDGEKYGLIGIAPPDMLERVKMNNTLKDFTIMDIETTRSVVQDEVKRLRDKEGINKIIILSHQGIKNDVKLAKETEGIDIIFGAHTHDLIEGIKEGVNLFYSKNGEPTIITQAGKDGENVGILNIDFDKNGIIKRAQNNIIKTRAYNRPLFIKDSVEDILGKPEVIGRVKAAVPPPVKRLAENNPHGNLIADAMKAELGTDIAILNAGNIRGSFSQGPIDTRLISDITPFEDHMMILELSEKQIVDSIKVGLKSITRSSNKPGILLVSGLKYKANTKGELLEMEFTDKNNQTHKIDVNNPRPDKKYTVAADDFYATGGDGYLESNKHPDFVLKKFDMDKNKLACNYIKKLDQPIEIKNDDRIQIIEG